MGHFCRKKYPFVGSVQKYFDLDWAVENFWHQTFPPPPLHKSQNFVNTLSKSQNTFLTPSPLVRCVKSVSFMNTHLFGMQVKASEVQFWGSLKSPEIFWNIDALWRYIDRHKLCLLSFTTINLGQLFFYHPFTSEKNWSPCPSGNAYFFFFLAPYILPGPNNIFLKTPLGIFFF